MLKYDKMKVREKPDALLAILLSIAQFLLVVIGLIGICVQIFREQGWLKQALASIMNTTTSSLVIGIPVVLLVILIGRSWIIRHSERKESSRTADIMLYVMMLVGLWFCYKLITEGSF